MSSLTVNNGCHASLAGLGKIRGLQKLSQKKITKAESETLSPTIWVPNTEVSCAARLATDGLVWLMQNPEGEI